MKRVTTWNLLTVAAVAALAGCASVPQDAPRFSPAAQAPEGYATVYVYRYGAPPYTQAIEMFIAGQGFVEAPDRAYTWMYVKPGTYNIEAKWPRPWPSTSVTRSFEVGQAYYFRLRGQVGSGTPSLFSSGMLLTSMIVPIEKATAEAEMLACCKFIKPTVQRLP